MRLIALLDTSVSSDNLGDEIIMDAVRYELLDALPDAYFTTVATHDYLGRIGRKILKQCEFGILGGANSMSSQMLRGANWKISPLDLSPMQDKVVLMGVGWQDYHPNASRYARYVYERVLSKKYAHSFRDSYTLGKAQQLGRKTLNTACPTMWRLDDAHCAAIPTTKAKSAVAALTFYRPDPDNDRKLMQRICDSYGKVYFWSQQAEDWEYLHSLGNFDVELIHPNVRAYTDVLEGEDVDFIGSRLHGGIRAMQKGRRALIVIVDNRAAEIGRDTDLPTVARDNHARIAAWIEGSDPVRLKLPNEAINAWRTQFG
ncbi:polysaccharide pyruvyl transferase family protein [Sphingomonas sp. ASY06-1R]|uniref:polysaccharide pyruvyl transferase family protein n=1 Tax=Sphingomonas sp. ASY06-1R TaxID=3445771 RepID=UPI003FA1CE1B